MLHLKTVTNFCLLLYCNSIYDVQAVHAEKGMQEEEKQDDLSTLNAFKRHNWVAYQFLQQ